MCYTLESCHIDALVCRAEGVTYISEDSLFSHYCLPLFEKYGIFALHEQGMDIEEMLHSYASKNCEIPKSLLSSGSTFLGLCVKNINLDTCSYLTDNDGAHFSEQVNAHVKYLEIEHAVDELLQLSSTDVPKTFTQTEDGVANINFDSINTSMIDKYIGSNISRTGETTEDLQDIDSKAYTTTILTTINHLVQQSLLSCIVPDPTSISTEAIDKAILPSVTCQLSQEGINASLGYYEDEFEATSEKASFCEYIYHMFGCYATPSDDGPLKYQMEYIISGCDSDDANLINTANQLISLRTGLNLIHLLSDSDKFNAAWSIAKSATAIPGLPYIIQATILTIWATAESVIDVRDLLSGKNVPLFKADDQWTLSIKGLLSFSKNTPSSNDGSHGLSYAKYLEMLMAVQNNISLRYRTMDLIQMELCSQYNENFRISKCVTQISGRITYTLPALLSTKKYTYPSNFFFKYQ